MERTLRRVGSGIILSLYFVWILAVLALLVTRFTPGPVPGIVNWTVTIGAAIATVIGAILLLYRSPRYVRRFRESLFR